MDILIASPRELTEATCPAAALCGLVDRMVGTEGRMCDGCPVLIDALLDFREVAQGDESTAQALVEAFFQLRGPLESKDYLAAFRLRRRLEAGVRVEIRVPGEEPRYHDLDLRWKSFAQLVGSYRREAFEMADVDFEAIAVGFVGGSGA